MTERGSGPIALHYGRFLRIDVRHGGTRRSQQLREILERHGVTVVDVALESERRRSRSARALGVMHGTMVAPVRKLFRARRLAGIYHRAMADLSLKGAPKDLPVVWEGGPGETFYGAWAAVRHGHRVVAVPQNLDSLTPGMASEWSGRPSPAWLDEELDELRHADATFVLSGNDRWLLALHGVEATVLPYHPPADVEEQLLELRRLRTGGETSPGDVLLLGTVGSEPTARGFLDLVRLLESQADLRNAASGIVVAGYGTERFRPAFERVGARVLGTVSDADLRTLQLSARALLVHYVPAPGALTRIPEALIAGMPIIANRHAARGYEAMPGLHVYDGPSELGQLLAARLPPPPAPARPVTETQFAAAVLGGAHRPSKR